VVSPDFRVEAAALCGGSGNRATQRHDSGKHPNNRFGSSYFEPGFTQEIASG